MSTIKDVAERAGVSTTTVSHVINNTRFVSEDLAARVNDAVKALRYQPNAIARSLRNKETGTIGMITPDNSNPFFAETARVIEDICFQLGYSVILCNSDQDTQKEQAYIHLLLVKQVDGIVFVAAAGQAHELATVIERNIPMVVVDRELRGIDCDCVLTDHLMGGRLATDYLIGRGRAQIACIAGPSDVTPSSQRVQGYREALALAGIEYNANLVERGNFQAPSGYEAMKRLLPRLTTPAAVFACNDLMALGAIRAISEAGLSVPADIAIVGYDNVPIVSYTNPPLTTVAQPYQEMARLATELLMTRMTDHVTKWARQILEPQLVIRQSA